MNKLTKQIYFQTILKSLMLAASLSSISFAICWFLVHNTIVLITIPIAMFLIAFGLFLKLLMPTRRKVAQRLDRELGLHEQLTTMYDYSNTNNPIVSAQRIKAAATAVEHQEDKVPFKGVIKFSCVSAAAIALAIGSAFVPKTTNIFVPEPEVITPTKPVDTLTQTEADEISNSVGNAINQILRDSLADPRLIEAIGHVVEELDNQLEGELDVAKRETYVNQAIDKVIYLVDYYTTAPEMSAEAAKYNNEYIKKLSIHLGTITPRRVYMLMNEVMDRYFDGTLDNEDFADGLRAAAATSTLEDDALAEAFYLCAQLYYDLSAVELDTEYEDMLRAIDAAMIMQEANAQLEDDVIKELKKLINPKDTETPPESETEEQEEEDGEGNGGDGETPPDGGMPGGGNGGGSGASGSDHVEKQHYGAKIFTPDEGYVEYGDVIESYMNTAINNINTNDCDADTISIVESYFNDLYQEQP